MTFTDAVPLWMSTPAGIENPYVDTHGTDHQQLRIRELSLPLEFRLPGKQRDLRDAYLGRFLLHDAMRYMTMPAVQGMEFLMALAQRENGRAQLNGIISELETGMAAEKAEKAKAVARLMFAWTIQQWRTSSARRR